MKSMTGYGRGVARNDSLQLTVEISAVNSRKNLDMRFSIPRDLGMIEPLLRQRIQARLSRGTLQVVLNFQNDEANGSSLLNREAVLAAAKELREIAELTGVAPPTIQDIISMPGIFNNAGTLDNDNTKEVVLSALDTALNALEECRLAEGAGLKKDLEARGRTIAALTEEIAAAESEIQSAFKARLLQRLNDLGAEITGDEERFARELCYYADKADITEEVVRLRNHMVKYFQLLESNGDPGRELDFLTQEMSREMNTLSAKTVDMSVSGKTLIMKIELSKIREQIMNIE